MLGVFLVTPISGGSLVSKLFEPETFFGGEHGVEWMQRWKYALPNVISAGLLFTVASVCFFSLEEVNKTRNPLRSRILFVLTVNRW